MAIQLGSAYGKVNIDSSGVKTGVDNATKSMGTLEKSAQKLGTTLQNVGKAMIVAVTIPLAMMAKDAVLMASSYEEGLNKVNVVFEENGNIIEEWSKNAAKNLGMSQAAALEAAGTYGNLFTAQGMGTKAAADMSTALVQLAADLASFNNANPEDVLLALRSGLSGEIEPLKKYGVAMNEALMKTKAMEMGLGDNIQALTEAQKIQVRYALIMDQTTKAQGDFARTSEGLANQLRILKGHWGDTLKILGANLVPVVEKVLVQLNKWLEWFNAADPKTQKFIATLLLIAFVAGPLLIIFGKLLPLAFGSATKSLNPFSGGIFGLVVTFIKWLGVAALIVKVLTFFGVSTGAAGTAIVGLQAAIAGAGASMLGLLGSILALAVGPVILYLAFKNNFMGITDTAKQLWFLIKFYFAEGWKWLVNAVQGGGKIVMDWFKRMMENIVRSFRNINWSELGRNMIMGIVNGLLGAIPAIISAAQKAGQAALQAMRKALDSHSPSREFMKIGVDSGDGYKLGLMNSVNPNTIAKMMAKPVQQMTTQQNNNHTIHMASGLTLRDVDEMMTRKIDNFTRQLNRSLGGA